MHNDVTKLLHTQEELLPELADMLEPAGGSQTFPMLRHPLVYAVPYLPQLNAMLNAQYKAKMQLLADYKQQRNWAGIIALYEKPYRVDALKLLRPKLPLHVYWELLANVWTGSENLESYTQAQLLDLLHWKRGHLRERMMTADERTALANMSPTLTVYHGYDPAGRQQRLSWTLELRVARFFATRMGLKHGRIAQGTVDKKHVLAYLTSRNEAEVIVHPRHVTVTHDWEVMPHER